MHICVTTSCCKNKNVVVLYQSTVTLPKSLKSLLKDRVYFVYICVKGKPLDRVPFRYHQTARDSLAFLLLNMKKILSVFVDEGGDTGFENGASNYYVVSLVFMNKIMIFHHN